MNDCHPATHAAIDVSTGTTRTPRCYYPHCTSNDIPWPQRGLSLRMKVHNSLTAYTICPGYESFTLPIAEQLRT
jgi:hypothetical protein